jgi:hypothetical protein
VGLQPHWTDGGGCECANAWSGDSYRHRHGGGNDRGPGHVHLVVGMSNPIVPKPVLPVVWVSRDSDVRAGGLLNSVKVWLKQPTRYKDEHGVYWATDDERNLWSAYTINDFLITYRITYPDDDWQLIKRG